MYAKHLIVVVATFMMHEVKVEINKVILFPQNQSYIDCHPHQANTQKHMITFTERLVYRWCQLLLLGLVR